MLGISEQSGDGIRCTCSRSKSCNGSRGYLFVMIPEEVQLPEAVPSTKSDIRQPKEDPDK